MLKHPLKAKKRRKEILCFQIDDRPPVDLSALNIQRGRDHGLAPYIHYVHYCGNKHIKSFRDLSKLISVILIYRGFCWLTKQLRILRVSSD